MVNINKDLKKLIEANPLALATVNFDNKPNVIAVACVKVVSGNQIIITDNYMKQTKKNLTKNNHVCLVVWDKDWNGYKLIGKAKYFSEGKWKMFVEERPENKGLPAKGAVLVTISQVFKLA